MVASATEWQTLKPMQVTSHLSVFGHLPFSQSSVIYSNNVIQFHYLLTQSLWGATKAPEKIRKKGQFSIPSPSNLSPRRSPAHTHHHTHRQVSVPFAGNEMLWILFTKHLYPTSFIWVFYLNQGINNLCQYINATLLSTEVETHWYVIIRSDFLNLRNSPGEIQNWPPYTVSKERPKKEADHFSLVGGNFYKQGNLHESWFCVHVLSCSVVFNCLRPTDGSPPSPLSIGFFKQAYWSMLPCPPPGGLPKPGKTPTVSPELQVESLPIEPLSWVTSRQIDHHICLLHF